jgi:hypothetical protein
MKPIALAGAVVALAVSSVAAAHPSSRAKVEERRDLEPSVVDAEAARAQAEARTSLGSIETVVARVRALLQRTRQGGTPAETACVDAALTRAHVSLRIAHDHAEHARLAWRRGDDAGARWELARLTSRREMAREAGRVAEACVATAAVFEPQQTTVRVIAPPLPDEATDFPRR